jgi:hypothetical protein
MVAVEMNQYNAMTLRARNGKCYQVVTTSSPEIFRTLNSMNSGDHIGVTLARTSSRGDGWIVTEADTSPNGLSNESHRQYIEAKTY